MRDVATKADGVDVMPAANYNAQRAELENAVLSADITLDPDAGPDTDLNMLGQTMAAYANAANVYQDSGSADTYVLSITSNLKLVPKYYAGMKVMFKIGNTNTGASTINVNAIGAKSFTLPDGTALPANALIVDTYVIAIYNLGSDRFELAIKEIRIIDEDDMQSNLTTQVPSQQSVKEYAKATGFRRAWFEDKDSVLAFTYLLSYGRYFHEGTRAQWLTWDAGITTPAASPTGVDTMVYLYLDNSAIVTADTNVITASELVWSETAPTYSAAKGGWYNGDDLCIFAARSNSGNTGFVLVYHDGGDYVNYDDEFTNRALSDLDAWEDVTLTIPEFASKAICFFSQNFNSGADVALYWRVNGSAAAPGNDLGLVNTNVTWSHVTDTVMTDSAQKIEVQIGTGADTTNQALVSTRGWFFPKGM